MSVCMIFHNSCFLKSIILSLDFEIVTTFGMFDVHLRVSCPSHAGQGAGLNVRY